MSVTGNGTASSQPPRVQGIRIQGSSWGRVIPLIYGTNRVPGTITWVGDPQTIFHKKAAGGKGGGETTSTTTYKLSVITSVARGPITAFLSAWKAANNDQRHTAAEVAAKWSEFLGAYAQAPWAHLTSTHPGEDLGYSGIAYLARQDWKLGNSTKPPQMNWEITGFLPFSATIIDAEPGAILADFLTDPNHGAGWAGGDLGDWTQYRNACIAAGFFISPVLDAQRTAADHIRQLLDMTLAESVFSDGLLKIVPYYDEPLTANGVTYTPALAPVMVLNDDNFVANSDGEPIVVDRIQPSDKYNEIKVEFVSRGNDYKPTTIDYKSQADIDIYRQRSPQTLKYHAVTNGNLARKIAILQLSRILNTSNFYTFTTGQEAIALDPTDIVTLNVSPTDTYAGLQAVKVRIVDVDMGDDHLLHFKAEDIGVCNAPEISDGISGGSTSFAGDDLLDVNAPVIGEPTAPMIASDRAGVPEVWISISGAIGGLDWGGAGVWMSEDGGSSYTQIGSDDVPGTTGSIAALAAYGGANPDNTNTIAVDLSESGGVIGSVGNALADTFNNLAMICDADGSNLEFIAFTTATVTGPSQYNLTRVNRGLYNTTASAHVAGSRFAYLGVLNNLDAGVFRYAYPARLVGQTVYFKFTSFDTGRTDEVDLGDATAYPYRIQGNAIVGTPTTVVASVGAGPTPGFHAAGEIVVYDTLVLGGPVGICCYSPGSPGKWAEFGALSPYASTLGAAALSVPWKIALAQDAPTGAPLRYPPEAILFATPVLGGASGKVCVVGGNPGSWVEWGLLSPFQKLPIAQTPVNRKWNVVVATEVPAGAHLIGDAIIYPNPGAGRTLGKICIAAGTRGTWAEFGPLSPV